MQNLTYDNAYRQMSLNSRANSIATHFKTKITTTAPQQVEMNVLRLQLIPPTICNI